MTGLTPDELQGLTPRPLLGHQQPVRRRLQRTSQAGQNGWSTKFLNRLDIPSSIQIVILLVSTPVIFLLTMKRTEKMSDGGGSLSLRCDLIGDRHARDIPACCPQEPIV
jgi:hypothetical protein